MTDPLRGCAMLAALLLLAGPLAAQGSPSQPLDTVRVTSRAASGLVTPTRSVEIVTREQLDGRASRSLADLLGQAVGVDVQSRSPAQSDLGMRGSTFNQVVVLVDGVRVSDVQSGHYALDLAVPLAMIERVEIMRGTGAALYGSDAVGGVINIVTRADSSFEGLSTRVGSFGGAGGSVAMARPAAMLRLRGAGDFHRSSGHRPGTDYRVTQLRGGAERHLGAARIAADLGIGVRHFGAADFYSPYSSFESTRSTTAAIRASLPASDAVTISAAAHSRRHSDQFTLKRDDPAFYQNAHLGWQSGAEATVHATLTPMVAAALGGELLDARLRSARLGDHQQLRRALFGEATFGRQDGATVNLGLRSDWSSDVGAFTSPSLAAALALGTFAQLRASAGRGFRAPTWTERFYRDPANIGDSTLAVERFTSQELGVRTTPFGGIVADVALFHRRARSLIDWARPASSPSTTPWRTMNFADATYRGIEGTVTVPRQLGIDWIVRASGLHFDASAESGTVGKYALRPLTRTLGLSAASPLGQGGRLTVDAMRARRSGERDQLQVNARFGQLLGAIELAVEGLNLTDADHLDVVGKPVAPRSVFVSVAWRGP